jgi:hypothetical protein
MKAHPGVGHRQPRALVSADRAFSTVEGLPFVELGSVEFDRLLA